MLKLPDIHQFANTDDVNPTVMITLGDKSRLVLFPLDPQDQYLLRVFYSGSYASYFIGPRDQIAEVLEEDLHQVGEVKFEDPATALPTLKNWGLTALANRFKKK